MTFSLMALVTGFASAMVVLFVVLLFTYAARDLTVRRSTTAYVADCAGCPSFPAFRQPTVSTNAQSAASRVDRRDFRQVIWQAQPKPRAAETGSMR